MDELLEDGGAQEDFPEDLAAENELPEDGEPRRSFPWMRGDGSILLKSKYLQRDTSTKIKIN